MEVSVKLEVLRVVNSFKIFVKYKFSTAREHYSKMMSDLTFHMYHNQ